MFRNTMLVVITCLACLTLFTSCHEAGGPSSVQQGGVSTSGGTGTVSGGEEGAGGIQDVAPGSDQGGGEGTRPNFELLISAIDKLERIQRPIIVAPGSSSEPPEDTGGISGIIGSFKKKISAVVDGILVKTPSQQEDGGQQGGTPGGTPSGGVHDENEYPDEHPDEGQDDGLEPGGEGIVSSEEAEQAVHDAVEWLEGLFDDASGGGGGGVAGGEDMGGDMPAGGDEGVPSGGTPTGEGELPDGGTSGDGGKSSAGPEDDTGETGSGEKNLQDYVDKEGLGDGGSPGGSGGGSPPAGGTPDGGSKEGPGGAGAAGDNADKASQQSHGPVTNQWEECDSSGCIQITCYADGVCCKTGGQCTPPEDYKK